MDTKFGGKKIVNLNEIKEYLQNNYRSLKPIKYLLKIEVIVSNIFYKNVIYL